MREQLVYRLQDQAEGLPKSEERRALLESNPSRNNQMKTTRDDESLGGIVPTRSNRIGQEPRIDRFYVLWQKEERSECTKVMCRRQIYSWANMLLHQMVTKMPGFCP